MKRNEPPAFQIKLRSKRVQRELDSLLEEDYTRVLAGLKGLANDPRPRGSKKLSGDIYRIRVGDIRIIYIIAERNKRIEVGAIQHRTKSTYKGFKDLFQY
jgi:mRNA interferase RelE/StbE